MSEFETTQEKPFQKCELCGAIEDCRPYGPNCEQICYSCGMKNKVTTQKQIDLTFGIDPKEHHKLPNLDYKKIYIGDGVYMSMDEDKTILLTTENGIRVTNSIVLEPRVYDNFLKGVKELQG